MLFGIRKRHLKRKEENVFAGQRAACIKGPGGKQCNREAKGQSRVNGCIVPDKWKDVKVKWATSVHKGDLT
eukprot:scaffold97888_cov14-Tisochrysis_lutea.AAC.1